MKILKFINSCLFLILMVFFSTIGIYFIKPDILPIEILKPLNVVKYSVLNTLNDFEFIIDFIKDPTLEDLKHIEVNGEIVFDTLDLEDSGIDGNELEFDSLYYPYYSFLNEDEQTIYKQIVANASSYERVFVPCIEISIENVQNAMNAVFYDHPELFWLDTSYSYKYNEDTCLQVTLNFNESFDDIESNKRLFNEKAKMILDVAKTFDSDFEKERYVHDTLISMTSYHLESKLNQSAFSALVNEESVCAGYARAFQYLMLELKIPTYYCTGVSNNEDHAWNIILIDGKYYNVDVTWDDSNDSKAFFNKSDVEFLRTHSRSEISLQLPGCDK